MIFLWYWIVVCQGQRYVTKLHYTYIISQIYCGLNFYIIFILLQSWPLLQIIYDRQDSKVFKDTKIDKSELDLLSYILTLYCF